MISPQLKDFVCRRCNECCRQPGFVYLSQTESERIAAFLNRSSFDFINEFCELQDRQKLVLKKRGEACIFLNDGGCRIHDVKPKQCRDFPFAWRTPKSFSYCEGLKALAREEK